MIRRTPLVNKLSGSTMRGADVLIVAYDSTAPNALTAGELACPDCQDELRPRGDARRRWQRTRHGRDPRPTPSRLLTTSAVTWHSPAMSRLRGRTERCQPPRSLRRAREREEELAATQRSLLNDHDHPFGPRRRTDVRLACRRRPVGHSRDGCPQPCHKRCTGTRRLSTTLFLLRSPVVTAYDCGQ